MPVNHVAENVTGTIGAVLWTIQILPQIWKSYREKSTHGLSTALVGIWGISSLPFSAYIVAQELSIPLQVQPHAFGVLCWISFAQCLYYAKKWSMKKVILTFFAILVVWAGFETGSVYALWAGRDHGTEAPLQLYGYLSAVLLAVALLPQFWEIYKLKEVVGISLIFLAIDIGGGVFSFVSLFFRPELDIAAFVSYLLVVVLDGTVIILAFILNPLARRRRRVQAEKEKEEESRVSSPTSATGTPAPEALDGPSDGAAASGATQEKDVGNMPSMSIPGVEDPTVYERPAGVKDDTQPTR